MLYRLVSSLYQVDSLAAHFNIIDKPNERSSHSSIVLRGGGITFLFGVWLWCVLFGFHYPLFLAAVTLAAGISFIDDIHSLPDSVRLVIQLIAMGLMIGQIFLSDSFVFGESLWAKIAFVVIALIVCVGATNIYNFMDGINGITAGYSLAVLVPLMLMNAHVGFVEPSFLIVMALAVMVFSFFNFRPRARLNALPVMSGASEWRSLFFLLSGCSSRELATSRG